MRMRAWWPAMLLVLLPALGPVAHATDAAAFARAVSAIEARSGGRIGVSVRSTDDRLRLDYRGDQRFALCSTFKLPLAAAVLNRIERGEERPDRRIAYDPHALVTHAPAARRHLPSGYMTVEELNMASLQQSDNTAANLLLDTLDGPAGFTAWLRGTGDATTRLDRNEPELNSNLPDDPRDTTTPAAMADSLRRLLYGDVLDAASRERLKRWLAGSITGDDTLRAGLPGTWIVGGKTGSGENGARNDVGYAELPDGGALLIAVYTSGTALTATERNRVIADVARAVAAAVPPTGTAH